MVTPDATSEGSPHMMIIMFLVIIYLSPDRMVAGIHVSLLIMLYIVLSRKYVHDPTTILNLCDYNQAIAGGVILPPRV